MKEDKKGSEATDKEIISLTKIVREDEKAKRRIEIWQMIR